MPKVFPVLAVWLMAGPLFAAEPAPVDPLHRALYKEAPQLIRYLRAKGYQNVGVLKFLVKKGNGPATDNAGPLNLTIANQLAVALVLANDNDPAKALGIVARASAVAAGIPGANHLTLDGRKKLFTRRYPLAWGTEEVVPDAFLTGVVEINADLSELTVKIQIFGRDGAEPEDLSPFRAAQVAATLVDSGESFLLRGGGVVGRKAVIQDAAQVSAGKAPNPVQAKAAPVELDILYDGKKMPVKVNKDGRAFVPEPREGQKVTFVLRRTDPSNERYGVVLKINGENTLYKQRLPAEQCTKWILDPGVGPITIPGFKTGVSAGNAFRVLSRVESKQKEINYGTDAGTISLVVFREKRGRDVPSLAEEEEDLAAILGGAFPETQPKNQGALKQQLLRESKTRGLFGDGDPLKIETVKVEFNTDPTPVMALTITYYRP